MIAAIQPAISIITTLRSWWCWSSVHFMRTHHPCKTMLHHQPAAFLYTRFSILQKEHYGHSRKLMEHACRAGAEQGSSKGHTLAA